MIRTIKPMEDKYLLSSLEMVEKVFAEHDSPEEGRLVRRLVEEIRRKRFYLPRLELLMAQINRTNCATLVDGASLTQLLARKDALSARLSAYRDLVYAASQTAHRATRGEIRIHSAIDVKATQKQVDQMARELRLLDNRLQGANWATELMED